MPHVAKKQRTSGSTSAIITIDSDDEQLNDTSNNCDSGAMSDEEEAIIVIRSNGRDNLNSDSNNYADDSEQESPNKTNSNKANINNNDNNKNSSANSAKMLQQHKNNISIAIDHTIALGNTAMHSLLKSALAQQQNNNNSRPNFKYSLKACTLPFSNSLCWYASSSAASNDNSGHSESLLSMALVLNAKFVAQAVSSSSTASLSQLISNAQSYMTLYQQVQQHCNTTQYLPQLFIVIEGLQAYFDQLAQLRYKQALAHGGKSQHKRMYNQVDDNGNNDNTLTQLDIERELLELELHSRVHFIHTLDSTQSAKWVISMTHHIAQAQTARLVSNIEIGANKLLMQQYITRLYPYKEGRNPNNYSPKKQKQQLKQLQQQKSEAEEENNQLLPLLMDKCGGGGAASSEKCSSGNYGLGSGMTNVTKLHEIYKMQLMQIPGVKEGMAAAIMERYPTVTVLLKEYARSDMTSQDKKQLLKGLQYKHIVADKSNGKASRREFPDKQLVEHEVGIQLSSRIYQFYCCDATSYYPY